MRSWIKGMLISAGVLPLLLIALILGGIERVPETAGATTLTVADLDRLRLLWKANDPRWLRSGTRRDVALSTRDIDLALAQLAGRLRQGPVLRAAATMAEGHADIRLSLRAPLQPLGNALAVGLRVGTDQGQLSLERARMGWLPLPGWLLRALLPMIEKASGQQALMTTLRELLATTQGWKISPAGLSFSFTARPDLAWRMEARGRDLVLPPAERERIAHYLRLAVKLGAMRPPVQKPLVPMLREVIAQAAQRSRETGDARAENRAAIHALAIYAVGRGDIVWRLLGIQPPRAAAGPIVLRERVDLAQHWLVSAALTIESDGSTADVIGLFKEVLDSRGGSGFSFADLTADRAGVRFAEEALAEPARWQQRVAALEQEADLMPAIDALPEGLQAPDFQRRFRARDNEAWRQMREEIERRIAACRFFAGARWNAAPAR